MSYLPIRWFKLREAGAFCGDADPFDNPAVCTAPATHCPAGMPSLSSAAGWQVSATTGGSTDYEGTCGGGEAGAIYEFVSDGEQTVLFTITGDGADPLNPPATYLQQACDLMETEPA